MRSRLTGIVILAAAGGIASSAVASDFTNYYIGNSLTVDLWYHFRYFANAYETVRGNTYHWGAQYRGSTSLSYLYNNPNDTTGTQSGIGLTSTQALPSSNSNPWNSALPANRWDAVTFEPFKDYASGPSDISTLGSDANAINQMIAQTRTNAANSSTRFFIYGVWPTITANRTASADNAQTMNDFTATTTNDDSQGATITRGFYQNLYNRVQTANPGVSISVIPVGEVFYSLTQKMAAGEFDGLTSIDQLHRDTSHADFLGQDIAAWTAYATIFKESPVGLGAGPSDQNNSGSAVAPCTDLRTTSLDAHDVNLIQQTVWDVVNQQSAYTSVPEPASGVLVLGTLAALCARRRR